jgi:hypothetical protein
MSDGQTIGSRLSFTNYLRGLKSVRFYYSHSPRMFNCSEAKVGNVFVTDTQRLIIQVVWIFHRSVTEVKGR